MTFEHTVPVRCRIIRESRVSILIRTGQRRTGQRLLWLQKAHIDDRSPIRAAGESGLLMISAWMARKKRLRGRSPSPA